MGSHRLDVKFFISTNKVNSIIVFIVRENVNVNIFNYIIFIEMLILWTIVHIIVRKQEQDTLQG